MRNFFKLPGMIHAYAASKLTTAVSTSGDNVQLPYNIRAVYSKEIEFKALPTMRFIQFAKQKTELGVQAGLTINMLVYDNLTKGGTLTEGTRMETQALSSSLIPITVSERGNAVAVSNLLLQASFDDVMASATTLLARDMALVLDCELRDVALTGTNVTYGYKADGTEITGRTSLISECVLSVAAIKDGIEILATNNCPKFDNAYYICFVHPHQSRGLRDDAAWIEASKYGAPDQLFTGEIGRIDDTRFIETTLMCNGAVASTDPAYKSALVNGTAGNQTAIYQACIFGEAYYGFASALPVELRDSGVVDFGRERGLAWYAIWGSAKLHNDYGVVIETA